MKLKPAVSSMIAILMCSSIGACSAFTGSGPNTTLILNAVQLSAPQTARVNSEVKLNGKVNRACLDNFKVLSTAVQINNRIIYLSANCEAKASSLNCAEDTDFVEVSGNFTPTATGTYTLSSSQQQIVVTE